ncbi:MAG: hypothetical protein HYZ54_04285 [Ignavibacteriae bacterium]|nr:hypothetical protein [Ignavibacteriota bacterium]
MNRILILFIALLLSISAAQGQIGITVVTRSPMPAKISEWQRDRSLFQIVITNPAGSKEFRNARISYIIKEFGTSHVIAQSLDDSPFIPRFTIPAGFSVTPRFGGDIISENATRVDPNLQKVISTTNSIPEGSYEFCVRLFDGEGNELGSTGSTEGICRLFNVVIGDPPSLILPEDKSVLKTDQMPIFVWTGVQTAGNIVRYKLRVTPVFKGQSQRFAIDYNPVMYEKITNATSIRYGQDGLPFSYYPLAVGFAWQVQAIDERNQPATRNDGKSEIFTFGFTKKSGNNNDSSSDTSFSGNGTGGGTLGGGKLNNNDSSNSGGGNSRANSIRRIHVGEFWLTLDSPQLCVGECSLSGAGKIYVAIFNDSIPVRFSGVSVDRKQNEFVATNVGSITSELVTPKTFSFAAVKWTGTTLEWTLDNATVNGWVDINWSAALIGNGTSRVSFTGVEFAPNAVKTTALPISLRQNGGDVGFGSCLDIHYDTLSIGIALQFTDPALKAFLAGEAKIPCLQSNSQTVSGRFRLPIDRISSDNLLVSLPVKMHDVHIGTLPLALSAETLLLDLSSEANYPAITPSTSCLYSPSWSNPLWRGMIIPTATVTLLMPSGEFTFESQNLLLEPISNDLKLSVKGHDGKNKTFKYGGFSILLDSLSLDLCQSTVQQLSAEGTLVFPAAHTKEWNILDSLKISLNADANWKWHATITNNKPLNLPFGHTALVRLQNGSITETSSGEGFLAWSQTTLSTPEENPTGSAQFPVKFFVSQGKMLDNSSYVSLQSLPNFIINSIPFLAKEAGFGIENGKWWCGFSGTNTLPDVSGLSGMELKHLRIIAESPVEITSDETPVSLKIGNTVSLTGNIRWGLVSGTQNIQGITGKLSATVHALSDFQLPMDFALSGISQNNPKSSFEKPSSLYWYARGGDIRAEGVRFVPECHLLGGVIGMGWNIRLAGFDSSAVNIDLNGGAISIPTIQPKDNSPLQWNAGLLFTSSNHHLYRYAATARLESGNGSFGSIMSLNGDFTVLPALGLSRGKVSGQISTAAGEQKSISLSGSGRTSIMGTTFENTEIHADFTSSESQILLGGLTKRWTILDLPEESGRTEKGSEISGAILPELDNATLRITPETIEFTKNISSTVRTRGKFSVQSISSNSFGWVEMIAPFCTKFSYTLGSSNASMNFWGATDQTNTAKVWLNNFAVLGEKSVLSVQSHSRASVAIEHSFRTREISVRVGDSQNSIILDGFAEKSEEKSPEGFVYANCLGNEWHKESGSSSIQTCEDISKITGQNSETAPMNIGVYFDKNHTCFLRNLSTTTITQGTKFEATFTIKKRSDAGDVLSSAKKIIELLSSLAPNTSFELTDSPQLTSSDIVGARVSIVSISNQFKEEDTTNNCAAFGSMECP